MRFPFLLSLLIISLLLSCQNMVGNRPGNIAPDFQLSDLLGKEHQLSQYKGKVIMLHFWTDWCNACRAEFPRVEDYYRELKSDQFELLAINVGQAEDISADFQKDFDISFPMLTDPNSLTQKIYRVQAYPTNYFIDPEGRIIRRITGWVDKQQVEVIIKQHSSPDQVAMLGK